MLRPAVSCTSRKPFKMAVKITLMEFEERSGIQIMLKWRNRRGVTWFLPPPGGAQAQTNLVSLIYLKMSFFVS